MSHFYWSRAPRHVAAAALAALVLAGCGAVGNMFPEFELRSNTTAPMSGAMGGTMGETATGAPAVIGTMPGAAMGAAMPRRTILPETLVGCRGHVLVPALGMTLVPTGDPPPVAGQYLREERLTPPYRVIRPGDRVTTDRNPSRLNVELDAARRVIDLSCG